MPVINISTHVATNYILSTLFRNIFFGFHVIDNGNGNNTAKDKLSPCRTVLFLYGVVNITFERRSTTCTILASKHIQRRK